MSDSLRGISAYALQFSLRTGLEALSHSRHRVVGVTTVDLIRLQDAAGKLS